MFIKSVDGNYFAAHYVAAIIPEGPETCRVILASERNFKLDMSAAAAAPMIASAMPDHQSQIADEISSLHGMLIGALPGGPPRSNGL
jgi:hypothetical protein